MTTTVVERDGNIGIVKGSGENKIFHPRGNFTLKIVAKVGGAKDGYVARITRAQDNVTGYACIYVRTIMRRYINSVVSVLADCAMPLPPSNSSSYFHAHRDCFFKASDAMHKTEFISAINTSFGSGGMFCTLSDVDLGNYLLDKVNTFMNPSNNPRILSAVENIGLQSDKEPPVYVLSPEVHCTCMT